MRIYRDVELVESLGSGIYPVFSEHTVKIASSLLITLSV